MTTKKEERTPAFFQGLSIQRDRKHCINFADNNNYLVGTVPYLQTL